MTIYTLQQFLYPLLDDSSISVFSPIKYFYSEGLNVQNLIGFLCSYDEINNYSPIKDGDGDDEDFKFLFEIEKIEGQNVYYFTCDYILDLDNDQFFYVDNISYDGILNPDEINEHVAKRKKIFDIIKL